MPTSLARARFLARLLAEAANGGPEPVEWADLVKVAAHIGADEGPAPGPGEFEAIRDLTIADLFDPPF